MRLQKLELERFCQFPSLTFTFPDIPGHPLTIIQGNNGFGKSNFLKALRTALEGFPRREEEARRLIHHQPGRSPFEPTIVRLSFVTPANDSYLIERSLAVHPRTQELTAHHRLTLPDGTILTEEKGIEDFLQELLPIDLLDYFFFDLEEGSTLDTLLQSHEGGFILEALEKILGLHLHQQLARDLEQVGRELRRQEAAERPDPSRLETELEAIETKIDALERRLDDLRQKRRHLDQRIEDLRQDQQRLLHGFNPQVEQRRTALLQERTQIETSLRTLQEQWKLELEERLPLRLMHDLLRQAIDLAEDGAARWQESEERARRRQLAEEIAAALAQGGEPWNSPLDATGEMVLFQRLLSILGLEETDDGEPGAPPPLTEAEVKHLKAALARAVGGPTIAELHDQRDRHQDRLRRIEAELPGLIVDTQARKALAENMRDLEEATQARATLNNTVQELRKELDTRRAQHKDLLAERERMQQAMAEQQRREAEQDLLRRLQAALGEITDTLRQSRVNVLQDEATAAFRAITNKPGIYDRIVLDPQSLDARLFDRTEREVPKDRLSIGEKTVLAFSILHGLQRASAWQMPLVIEAPLKALDPIHTRRLLERFLPTLGEQVVLLIKEGDLPAATWAALTPHLAGRYELQRPAADREESTLTALAVHPTQEERA
ncbi:MAG: DNA sulfur modification protein DndD [Candidatus Ozemobacter sibiricus]|jgi:DNA sulfur modification protein DndD|uniref:DNA sulfur modification protein DndD n=1 Tax=Candidatus Ozemobacter sibiricus TaxID=2268124 RepID=A0A367ZJC3_9BACT|nr:MAG: DNA sulfur modification protein DndD [Candidatus Ozemobacter sibiricus]